MSFGGGRHVAPCNTVANTAYVTAIQAIRLAGAPVVIASGNDAYDDAIGFPACLPGAIKVTAVANNLNANARGFFTATTGANVANPTAFGVDFFAAPGGGNNTFVQSSVSPGYGTQWLGLAGTSQAAPQMAGLYATYKAVNPTHTVDEATAWLRSPTNAVAVPMTSRAGTALGFSILRPRLNLGQP